MSATSARHERLLADFAAGGMPALARAVSVIENHRPGFDTFLAHLQPRIGRARRIGITGPPGAGKSTITTGMVRLLREAGLTVGVVAVDPTSPFTGGALLGDRIRMESVALDSGVFIRSMATRGSLGGLAAATREVADVLDAFGLDRVIIETVGVGQTELDIAHIADSSVVVLVPESGDSIQTLKAGLMEIADVFVVNKADRLGADRLRHELELMLGMRRAGGGTMKNVPAHHGVDLSRAKRTKQASKAQGQPSGAVATDVAEAQTWTPPVLRTVASKDEGIGDLLEAVNRHFDYLQTSGALRERRRARLRDRVVDVVEQRVRTRLWTDAPTTQWLDAQVGGLETGSTNPFDVADALLARSQHLLTRTTS